MKVLVIYTRLYATCLRDALRGAGKNAWTLFLPFLLILAFEFGGRLLAPLGIVGGILLALVRAALVSCYLHFVSEIVNGSPVRIDEFQKSIKVYFWSVVNLFFVIWIAQFVLGMLLGPAARGGQIFFALYLVAAVALNAAPEVIAFRGTYGGLQTIQTALRFLQENPLEWLIPNVLLGAAVFWVFTRGMAILPFPLGELVLTALLHLFMLFRGHLFQALAGSSHRQRMFKYRYGG